MSFVSTLRILFCLFLLFLLLLFLFFSFIFLLVLKTSWQWDVWPSLFRVTFELCVLKFRFLFSFFFNFVHLSSYYFLFLIHLVFFFFFWLKLCHPSFVCYFSFLLALATVLFSCNKLSVKAKHTTSSPFFFCTHFVSKTTVRERYSRQW